MISVVMSVYNGEKYLSASIESVLMQTYQNFEFIIVDDGSTDATLEILQTYAKKDNRIKIITRQNKGLIFSLNEAFKFARGNYIARMDADDICQINRLEVQKKFLDENYCIDVVGSDVIIFSDEKETLVRLPKSNSEIESSMLFSPPFVHPSVMIRKSCIIDYGFDVYRENYKGAEDFELWIRIFNGRNFSNIPIVLLKYRRHENSVTQIENKSVLSRYLVLGSIYKLFFKKFLNIEFDEEQIKLIFSISSYERFQCFSHSPSRVLVFLFFFTGVCLKRLKFNILKRFTLRIFSLYFKSV